MSLWAQWREQADQREALARWRADGALDDTAWQRAHALAGPWPDVALWRRFLDQLSLWLAVALLGAALICFIAANWEALGRFARLYGAQGVMTVTALAAWRLGLQRPAGQAALVLAAIALGGVLALVGQTYQTGADTWQLFASWAALLLPWLIAARSPAMSLVWAVVANLALALYLDERWPDREAVMIGLGLFNLGLFLLWQVLGTRLPELAGRSGPRLLAAAALAWLSLAAIAEIFGGLSDLNGGALAWLLGTGAIAGWAWLRQRDIAILSLVALAVIVVDTCLLGRLLLHSFDLEAGGFLLLTLSVLAQVALASAWLRHLARAPA